MKGVLPQMQAMSCTAQPLAVMPERPACWAHEGRSASDWALMKWEEGRMVRTKKRERERERREVRGLGGWWWGILR